KLKSCGSWACRHLLNAYEPAYHAPLRANDDDPRRSARMVAENQVKRGLSNSRIGNGNACFNNGEPQASADRCRNVSSECRVVRAPSPLRLAVKRYSSLPRRHWNCRPQ
ncbi:MAG: hypothetical protein RIC55_33195, partial [Pirellulaceae bacterium]